MDYLFKSSICMTAFYGLYFFGFRKLSFHTLNRFYLLASLALSLLIPMLNYERKEVVIVEPNPVSEVTYSEEKPIQSIDNQTLTITPQSGEPQPIEINWMQVLTIIYLSGMVMMLFIFLRNMIIILKSLTSASLSDRFEQNGNTIIMLTERSQSPQSNASFFNYIFLNPDNLNSHEQALIIAHESFHAKKLHTIDLLLVSLLKAIFWFNPIIYFYQKSLKQIHEYEVDTLMSAAYNSQEYAHLLLKLGVAPNSMIINQFSTKPLSDRIQFLFKTPTKNMKKLLYFLAIPIIGFGIAAFAEEQVKVVYQEKESEKVSQKSIPTQSPLKVFYKNSYGMNLPSLSVFSERNLTVNDLFLLPAAIYYDVNPNFLTSEVIEETNSKLKSEGYKIIINDKETDFQNNFTKLTISIKNLKTNQTTQVREIDMAHAREVGKQGAWIFFAIYKNHFQDSDIILTEGSSDLAVNIGEKVATTIINQTSNLQIAKKDIIYKVSPDRLNLKTFEKVKVYFAKEGFGLSTKNEAFDKNNNLVSLIIQIDNGKEQIEKYVILNNLRHLIRLKTESKDKARRWDETLVIEANKGNKEVKISYDDRWFQGIKKSGKHEIMEVITNEKPIDLDRFNHPVNFTLNFANIDSLTIIADGQVLMKDKDFIIKDKYVYLDQKYEKAKVSIRVQMSANIGGPGSYYLYPNLIKLEEKPYPMLNKVKNLPIFVANKNNMTFAYNSKLPKLPTAFSQIAKSKEIVRTTFEAYKLGENPLVIINRTEYPSSILYRLNPDAIASQHISSPDDKNTVLLYGEKAKDGCIEIETKKGFDLFLNGEENSKRVIENVKKQIQASKKRVRREVIKDADGKEYERISVMRLHGEDVHFWVVVPIGGKALYIVDGKVVSEDEVDNSNQKFIWGGCGKIEGIFEDDLIVRHGEYVKKYDAYFKLNSK